MKLPTALVLIALIIAGTVGGYFFYQEYKLKYDEERQEERQHAQEEKQEALREEMYDIASDAAEWIVKESYGGGSGIDWDIDGWNYNDYKGEHKIEISINWGGKNFGGHYAASGIIRADDSEITWEPTWNNEELTDFLEWRNIFGVAVGSVVVLGALSEISE